jgi:hypothetical protein
VCRDCREAFLPSKRLFNHVRKNCSVEGNGFLLRPGSSEKPRPAVASLATPDPKIASTRLGRFQSDWGYSMGALANDLFTTEPTDPPTHLHMPTLRFDLDYSRDPKLYNDIWMANKAMGTSNQVGSRRTSIIRPAWLMETYDRSYTQVQ